MVCILRVGVFLIFDDVLGLMMDIFEMKRCGVIQSEPSRFTPA